MLTPAVVVRAEDLISAKSGSGLSEITRCELELPARVEWGSRTDRIGVELRFVAADLEFRARGDGSAIGMPRVDHAFGVGERSVHVGYSRSF